VRALQDFNGEEVLDKLRTYAQAELLPKMRSVQRETDIRLQPLSAYPGLATSPDSEAARLLALLSGSTGFGAVAFGTEGGLFEHAGIPTVVCGPGSTDQGHKRDEFVMLEQLMGCDAMRARLAEYLSRPVWFVGQRKVDRELPGKRG
jgi:acetylornithine deacetylase